VAPPGGLNVPMPIAKTILDYIKKGEIQMVREESERLGNG